MTTLLAVTPGDTTTPAPGTPDRVDAVIVGAGVAGLAAARALRQELPGGRVLVVEARDRLGGRVFTERDAGLRMPIELGAEFIHGSAPEVFRLAKEARLTTYDVGGRRFVASGRRLRPASDIWARLADVMRRIDPALDPDRSFRQFLEGESARRGRRRLPPKDLELAAQFVEGFQAADTSLVSARSLSGGGGAGPGGDDDVSEGRMGRVLEGYGALVEWLANGTEIRLGVRVVGIAWSRGEVAVDIVDGPGELGQERRVEAAAAIVTVPIGVLNAPRGSLGAIDFTPPLEQKRGALAHLTMGSVVKVVLRLRERFWADEAYAKRMGHRDLDRMTFALGTDDYFATWWTEYPLDAPVAVGWAGGPRARRLAEHEDPLGVAIRSFAKLFGLGRRKALSLVESAWMHDWEHDPYSRGAYSYCLVGGYRAGQILARPLEQTLFFAGEATSNPAETGTVDGAIASGQRAARQVAKALRVDEEPGPQRTRYYAEGSIPPV